MSDDRMDRAERIRNMREGNRSADDADDASATDASQDRSAPTDAGTSTDESAASGADDAVPVADDAANDAQAAAQRAAESAAQVVGTEANSGQNAAAGANTGADTTAEADTPNAGTGSDGPAGATGASTAPGDISGVELPDQQLLEEAMATSGVESTEGGARAAMEGETSQSEEVVRVLEFSLGDEYYCLDIEYVEEIVKRNAVTRVPNTPAFVDGVVDLRGQITTILEPKGMMDIESGGRQNLIIVFDPEQFEDQGAIGWVVDEVRQVVPVTESEVNTPPVDAEYINGVVDREEYEQFVIWVEPEDALAQATGGD